MYPSFSVSNSEDQTGSTVNTMTVSVIMKLKVLAFYWGDFSKIHVQKSKNPLLLYVFELKKVIIKDLYLKHNL